MIKTYTEYTTEKVEEGFLLNSVKKLIGMDNVEYINSKDADEIKFRFANLYVDHFTAFTYPVSLTSVVFKPSKIMTLIQDDLKKLIKLNKNMTWSSTDKVNVLYTGSSYKQGTMLIDVLEKVKDNIQTYVKNNLDRYINYFYSTAKLMPTTTINKAIGGQYKKSLEYIFKPGNNGRTQFDIIGGQLLHMIKKHYGFDLINMCIDDSKQPTQKYIDLDDPKYAVKPETKPVEKKETPKPESVKPKVEKPVEKTEDEPKETPKVETPVETPKEDKKVEVPAVETPTVVESPKVDIDIDSIVDEYIKNKKYETNNLLVKRIKRQIGDIVSKGITSKEEILKELDV